MPRLAAVALALGLCAEAARVSLHEPEAASQLELSSAGEEGLHRAPALFQSAFPELHEAGAQTCPFASTDGQGIPFSCNYRDGTHGRSCPSLQQDRVRAANMFIAGHHQEFVSRAMDFPLKELFDKSPDIVGDESFEQLVAMHIKGLTHPDMVQIEDKIIMKGLANQLKVPTTISYYGAHASDWSDESFSLKMRELCDSGIDDFIIKATHLAWGDGMKIVRGWTEHCKDSAALDREVASLLAFIHADVLGQVARESDAHLRKMEPGVTIEELFKTGGNSARPMEAKVQVIWGKVYMMFFVGQDIRGCDSKSGAWTVYGDKTGWDMKGMIGTEAPNDEVNQDFLDKAFDKVVTYAEAFATGIGADYTRVDFFLGTDADGEPLIKMNEAETVSGNKYVYERLGMSMVWRGGYVVPNRFHMTPQKWDKTMEDALVLRKLYQLD